MKSTPSSNSIENQRLDNWLWVSRFYRTRKLAANAANAGHVEVNETKAKPGKSVKPGDEINLIKNTERFKISVLALSSRRLSASLAAKLFEESTTSKELRLEQREQRSKNLLGVRYERSKPDKRDRKRMMKIKNQNPNIDADD
jgi:ribosome-associated heat shock protein Hsp15